MLREIKPHQLETERERGDVLIILGDVVYSEDEFWESARILIDYDEDEEMEIYDEPEEEPEEEETEPEPEEKPKKRGGARHSKEKEVLAAWNGGERTVDEIVEMTGISKQTVMKYIS